MLMITIYECMYTPLYSYIIIIILYIIVYNFHFYKVEVDY
jgi:hypothetical protein